MKTAHIQLDGKAFLTEESDGRILLWDQGDFPRALPLAELSREQENLLIEGKDEGRKLLKIFYDRAQLPKREAKQFNRDGKVRRS